MNGIELQRLLRAKGIITPIIFITAFPDDRLKARALDDASSCMLSKRAISRCDAGCRQSVANQSISPTQPIEH
jgi:CheY-like chemotaxis protein